MPSLRGPPPQSMASCSQHVRRCPSARHSMVLLLALPWGGMGQDSALTSPQGSEICCGWMFLSEGEHQVQGLTGNGPGVPLLCNTCLCRGAAGRSDVTSGARVSRGGGWGGFPLGTAGPTVNSLGSASAVVAAQQGTRAKILCALPTESCHWTKSLCSEEFQRTGWLRGSRYKLPEGRAFPQVKEFLGWNEVELICVDCGRGALGLLTFPAQWRNNSQKDLFSFQTCFFSTQR